MTPTDIIETAGLPCGAYALAGFILGWASCWAWASSQIISKRITEVKEACSREIEQSEINCAKELALTVKIHQERYAAIEKRLATVEPIIEIYHEFVREQAKASLPQKP